MRWDWIYIIWLNIYKMRQIRWETEYKNDDWIWIKQDWTHIVKKTAPFEQPYYFALENN